MILMDDRILAKNIEYDQISHRLISSLVIPFTASAMQAEKKKTAPPQQAAPPKAPLILGLLTQEELVEVVVKVGVTMLIYKFFLGGEW